MIRQLIREYGVKQCIVAVAQTILAAFCIWALLVLLFAVQAAELVIPGEAPDNLEGRYIYRAPLDDLQAWEWVGFTAGTDNRWTLPDDYDDFCWKYANVTRELPGNWTEELSPTDTGCQKRAGCHND